MAVTLASPLTPTRAFRPARRVDPRLWVGAGLGLLAAVGLLVVLGQVMPVQQEVLQVTRDLAVGATVQATDVSAVRVQIPDSMARDALGPADVDRVVGARLAVPLRSGHLLAPSDLAPAEQRVQPGRTLFGIAWDAPAGAASDINPGDSVVVFSTPRQGAAAATVVIDRARVVRVVRPQGSVASGGVLPLGGQRPASALVRPGCRPGGAAGSGGAHERS